MPESEAAAEPNLVDPSEFMRLLGLRFDQLGPTRLTAHFDCGPAHHQPWGRVHGGVYASVIETAATTGAYLAVRGRGQLAVGITNTSHFLRAETEGRMNVLATAVHQGRSSQLWEVAITRARDGKPVARGSVRLHNLDARTGDGEAVAAVTR
jgi:1,4-dihydroxy-2-naphthoyl-CoA hydrolase